MKSARGVGGFRAASVLAQPIKTAAMAAGGNQRQYLPGALMLIPAHVTERILIVQIPLSRLAAFWRHGPTMTTLASFRLRFK
jgi:hypothetical protein